MSQSREKNASKPLRGYPRKGAFVRTEEVKAYFGTDKLACLLCGREYALLSNHLWRVHDISKEDYKLRFGIPAKYGLIGKSRRAQSSRHLKRLRREGKVRYSPSPATLRKAQYASALKRRPLSEATRHENLEKLLRFHGKDAFWGREDYEEFFRHIKSGRTPREIEKDKGMPTRKAFLRYLQRDPNLKKKYEEIWEKLPIAVQARANKTGERYRRTLVRLRRSGKTWAEVAQIMGVEMSAVRGMWHSLKKKGKLKKYI